MARSDKALVSFNSGEWSPLLHARIDLEKAGSACRTLENMEVQAFGNLDRRKGTQFIAKVEALEEPTSGGGDN